MRSGSSFQSTSSFTESTTSSQSTSPVLASPFQLDETIRLATNAGIFRLVDFATNEEEAQSVLNRFNTNAELLRHFYTIMKEKAMLPNLRDVHSREKNEEMAQDAEKRATSYMDDPETLNYIEALKCYNESLCWAEEGSETMGRVYFSRSSIYAKTGFYKFALDNIEKASNTKFPKIRDLKKKKKEIEEMQKKGTKDSYEIYGTPGEITLSRDSLPKIPGVVNALECAYNAEFGRYIVAKSDLKPGEILILEKPFLTAPFKEFEYSTCYNCSAHNFYNLMPCPDSGRAMFCSKECMEDVKPIAHIIDALHTWVDNTFALRATLKAFKLFDNPAELQTLIAQGTDMNPFECDLENANERTKFRIFNSLSTNQEHRPKLEILQIVYKCVVMFHMVKMWTSEFSNKFSNNNDLEDIFLELLMRYYQIGGNNNYDVVEPLKRRRKRRDAISFVSNTTTARGNYILSSLFAHSCAPNVSEFSADTHGKLGIVALHPIKAGEPLFISYGSNFFEQDKEARQEELATLYQFVCNCVACQDVERFNSGIRGVANLPEDEMHLSCKIYRSKCVFNEKTQEVARELMEKTSKYISKNFHQYPSTNIYEQEKCLLDAIHVMAFKKPIDLIFANPEKKRKCPYFCA